MKRYGDKRAPGCTCEHNYTCRACLTEAGHRAQAARFGVLGTEATTNNVA